MTSQTSDGTAGLSSALQDYLEAMLSLERERVAARVRDIASTLNVHKSTVTAALRALAERGLVKYSPYELATLTPEGRRIAEGVSQNHAVIARFLREVLLVDDQAAGDNACRMEHVMDAGVLERLVLMARFLKARPAAARRWTDEYGAFVARETRGGRGKRDPMEASPT